MLISYGKYDYDTERDCFVCSKCGFETPDEDEMILHKQEEEAVDKGV